MSFINKFGKTTVASSILNFASVLGQHTCHSRQVLAKVTKANKDKMKITWPSVTQRILKRYFHGRRWYGTCIQLTYRYYADNPNTKELDQTAFDKYLKGTNRTNPNDPKENVTD